MNRIDGLRYIREEGGELAIGALSRERELETSPLIREKCPMLAEAVSQIGHLPVRTRGTVGGSLVHADPSAEIPTVACALGARMKVVGPAGERTLAPEEFFLTYLTSALEPSEILVEVRFPIIPPKSGWAFVELSRRHGDFAIVAVATLLSMKGDLCEGATIALGGVGPTPLRAEEAERTLVHAPITEARIEEAAGKAAEAAEPESDYHASAEYRKDMARVFVKRGLKAALQMTKGGA
jgi:carbon-monoxide dehydrogenase medium subunit/2-furoyl-CoA dehydrogenase FAD binding subunit